MVLAFSLLGDQCLDGASKANLVPQGPGSDEVEEKIGTRHRVLRMADLAADRRGERIAKGAWWSRNAAWASCPIAW